MSLKEQIDKDLKSAMLGGDKVLATTLRGLKSAFLYEEVALGKRDSGLSEAEVTVILRKEAKKRQESAGLFAQGGNQEKADAELEELKVINDYLPAQLSEDALSQLVAQAVEEIGEVNQQTMGRVIGRIKELSNGAVDGGRIASAVKARMKTT